MSTSQFPEDWLSQKLKDIARKQVGECHLELWHALERLLRQGYEDKDICSAIAGIHAIYNGADP